MLTTSVCVSDPAQVLLSWFRGVCECVRSGPGGMWCLCCSAGRGSVWWLNTISTQPFIAAHTLCFHSGGMASWDEMIKHEDIRRIRDLLLLRCLGTFLQRQNLVLSCLFKRLTSDSGEQSQIWMFCPPDLWLCLSQLDSVQSARLWPQRSCARWNSKCFQSSVEKKKKTRRRERRRHMRADGITHTLRVTFIMSLCWVLLWLELRFEDRWLFCFFFPSHIFTALFTH